MNLDEVLQLPKSGVIVLFKDYQVMVTYTTSMGAYLEKLYMEYSGQKGIRLEVFSVGADLETLKLHTEYYRDYYSRQPGLILLQAHLRKTVQYDVRAVPCDDFKSFKVELVTARGDSKMVGKFDNSAEAKAFIETYYGEDNPFRFPVYALNCDTKQFLEDNRKRKLLTIV
jgi:hypothetical protein